MSTDLPIARLFDLADLSDAGHDAAIVATPAELGRIAEWEGVQAVTLFEGKITLARKSQSRFSYDARLVADIVQNCVVTLEPVTSRIELRFSRSLHYVPGLPADRGGALTLAAGDDEVPEEIGSLRFDLAAPLLEEFSLAVDPYPRAPGVAFEPPADDADGQESPFAVLKSLKRG